ncbi:hypothetical protein WHI96_04590 [Pseudonocardia tropica]|uniref:Uncharacterized protein n=1 Tax=Pseudonocardia tropica TaxID=681289 RepID=A0ABV1JQ60_9PSEU
MSAVVAVLLVIVLIGLAVLIGTLREVRPTRPSVIRAREFRRSARPGAHDSGNTRRYASGDPG